MALAVFVRILVLALIRYASNFSTIGKTLKGNRPPVDWICTYARPVTSALGIANSSGVEVTRIAVTVAGFAVGLALDDVVGG